MFQLDLSLIVKKNKIKFKIQTGRLITINGDDTSNFKVFVQMIIFAALLIFIFLVGTKSMLYYLKIFT